MLDVDGDEAEIVVLESPLTLSRRFRNRLYPTVQALCFEDARDAVVIEVGQEVADNKAHIIGESG